MVEFRDFNALQGGTKVKGEHISSDYGKKVDVLNKVISILNQPKVALIIGNSEYSGNPLRNSVNDAKAMSSKLKELGFDVTLLINASLLQMKKAISEFGNKLGAHKSTLGLFYYAGHGMQIKDKNYLIPVDAIIEKEPDVELYSLDLGSLLTMFDYAGNKSNIIILDACRNNPFQRGIKLGQSSGLAPINASSGTIIAFATAPGTTASDGDGANGLYTQELVNAINTPDIQLEDIFKIVRINVKLKSNNQQIPWENSALEEKIYFKRSK
jgi:uncharacterized caspase-like protein